MASSSSPDQSKASLRSSMLAHCCNRSWLISPVLAFSIAELMSERVTFTGSFGIPAEYVTVCWVAGPSKEKVTSGARTLRKTSIGNSNRTNL